MDLTGYDYDLLREEHLKYYRGDVSSLTEGGQKYMAFLNSLDPMAYSIVG